MTADPVDGQAGYFLDHGNRRSFGDLAEAGDVLDVFCYGGFSCTPPPLAPAPCSRPTCRPTPIRPRHLAANAVDVDHQTMTGDAFEIMEQLAGDGRRFDQSSSIALVRSALTRAWCAAGLHPSYAPARSAPSGATLMQASCTSRIDTEISATVWGRRAGGTSRRRPRREWPRPRPPGRVPQGVPSRHDPVSLMIRPDEDVFADGCGFPDRVDRAPLEHRGRRTLRRVPHRLTSLLPVTEARWLAASTASRWARRARHRARPRLRTPPPSTAS